MEQPDNQPEWATHWSPAIGDYCNNTLGFWLGEMDKPFPLFRGVTWSEDKATARLGGKSGTIYQRAIPIIHINLENE